MAVTVVSTTSDGGEVNESRVGDAGGEGPDGWGERDGLFYYFERRRHLVAGWGEEVERELAGRGKFRDCPANEHHANFNPESRMKRPLIPVYSTNYLLFDCPVSFVSFADTLCEASRFPIPRFFHSSRSMSPLHVISDLSPIEPRPRAPVHATVKVILAEDSAWCRRASVRLEAVQVPDHIVLTLACKQRPHSVSGFSSSESRYVP